jgi:hypothetical protein
MARSIVRVDIPKAARHIGLDNPAIDHRRRRIEPVK